MTCETCCHPGSLLWLFLYSIDGYCKELAERIQPRSICLQCQPLKPCESTAKVEKFQLPCVLNHVCCTAWFVLVCIDFNVNTPQRAEWRNLCVNTISITAAVVCINFSLTTALRQFTVKCCVFFFSFCHYPSESEPCLDLC